MSIQLSKHPKWNSNSNVFLLASSMIRVYLQIQSKFNRDMYGHYLFTPRELTNWCLSFMRYNLNDFKDNTSVEPLLEIWTYEAFRIFQDRLVDNEAREQFETIISNVLQEDWRTGVKLKGN